MVPFPVPSPPRSPMFGKLVVVVISTPNCMLHPPLEQLTHCSPVADPESPQDNVPSNGVVAVGVGPGVAVAVAVGPGVAVAVAVGVAVGPVAVGPGVAVGVEVGVGGGGAHLTAIPPYKPPAT